MAERIILIHIEKVNTHVDKFSYSIMNSEGILENHSILIDFTNSKIYNLENNEIKIVKQCLIDAIKKEYPKNTFNF
jgi:hypothetical protein